MYEIMCFDEYGNSINEFVQWDTNRVMYIDWEHNCTPIFQFGNTKSDRLLVVKGRIIEDETKKIAEVNVPNILLQQAYPIIGFVYLESEVDGDEHYYAGKTVYNFKIPVRAKVKPEDYKYTENTEYISWINLESEAREYLAELEVETNRFKAEYEDTLGTAKDNADRAVQAAEEAKVSEDNAKESENKAKDSEEAAYASEVAAKASQDAAKLSEDNAHDSEVASKESEEAAKSSEQNAKASENAAKTSEGNAKVSEVNAKESEENAARSETKAKESEVNAKNSEDNARVSEANAKISETNAKNSEVAAKASEEAAKISEQNAKVSEENAKASELAAKASEEAAKGSEESAANVLVRAEEALANSEESLAKAEQAVEEAEGLTAAVEGAVEETVQNAERAEVAADEAAGHAERAKECADTIDTSVIEAKLAAKGDNLEFDYDTNLLYLTSEGERIGDGIQVATGVGGGGGTSLEYTITLKNLLESRVLTVAAGNKVELKYTYSSVDSEGYTDGNGVGKLTINGAVKPALSVVQGENILDVTSMLSVGANTIKIRVENSEGAAKTLSYTVNVVAATITSSFDVSAPFTGDIQFDYTPNGAVEKTVYFEVDGTVIGTQVVTASGKQQSYTIPAQAHGSHALRVWFECVIEGADVTSNELYYEFASIVDGNTTPIITSNFQATDVTQYDTVVISYRVYTPNSLTSTIDLLADNVVINDDLSVNRTEQYWSYRVDSAGDHTLKIQCGSQSKSWTFNAADANVDVEAETNNLALYLSSYGRNNNEANPATWEYSDIAATLSNFNFASDGWQMDEDGVTVLRVAGDARVAIPAQIFANDFRATGKTIEVEFASRDVLDYEAVIISCMAGGRGLQITAQRADLFSEQSSIGSQYKENEHIRVSFVVEKRSDNRFLMVYINGILSAAEVYPTDDNFMQSSPVGISIGSNMCTTDIYCIRVYDNNLNRYQILDNWIADTQNGALMIERYNRNQIYNDADEVTIANLPADLPYLVIEAAALPQFKGDKQTCAGYYVDFLNPSKSFTFENAQIDVQGTSSQYYYVKNYKIKFKEGFKNDSGVVSESYQLNSNVIGTNEFTFKADVASSEGANNVVLAQLYNDLCPSLTPPQEKDSRVRQTIDGHPIVIFWNDGTNLTFLGKYNFNNDKGTPEVFGFAEGDESWEIRQNGTDLVGWKSDDFSGDWGNDFEARYPEDNTDITNLQALSTWLVSTNTEAATNEALTSAVTYDGVEYTTDSAEYRLAKFRAELPDHADVDAMVFYYLFTEIFLCIDQREKNAFPTLFAEAGKWLMFFYDADSSLGIDNKGKLAFDYYLEDIDYTEGGDPVYNGQGSVLWVNMRKAYYTEIMAMYQQMRVDDVISYDIVDGTFEAHQSKWCEAIFNEDMYRKCLVPMIEDGDGQYLPMLLGKKEMHRKWWLYNRFRFLDSKYITGSSMDTRIMIRAKSKANVWLTPYVNMYGHVYYNDEHVEHRMERGVAYEYVWSASGAEDAVIGINDADMITSLGDLSALQVETIDIAKAIHLTSLKVGDASSSYSNKNLTTVTLGNNTLLRSIDLRNCSSLNTPVDASGCVNIEEVYCEGTSITGFGLPNGGILKVLHLPATLKNLTIRNHKITDFVLPSYNNITTLNIENVEGVPTQDIIDVMAEKGYIRLVGFDWTYSHSSEVFALYDKLDTMNGIDESGNYIDYVQVVGHIHVSMLSEPDLADMRARYPDVEITYDQIVYSVNFYNDDGTVLLGRASTDSANNAVYPNGTPTKESTAQYDYKFAGWALTVGGTIDAEALRGVTADRNVYAVFNSILRYYTVNFYNGETLLDTRTVAYGGSASYDGSSLQSTTVNDPENWNFSGWSPDPSYITGDTNCYAQFRYAYITDSWETIIAAVNDGSYADKYAVGDFKSITIDYGDGTYDTVDMIIGDLDHDDLADGSGKAAITWIAGHVLSNPQIYGSKTYGVYTGYKGWVASSLKTWCNETLLAALPEALQSAIKEVTTVYNYASDYSTMATTSCTDKIKLLSRKEVGLDTSYNCGESYPIFTNAASRIRTIYNSTDVLQWWLREVASTHTSIPNVACISTSGYYTSSDNDDYEHYICFAFCI